MPIIIIVISVSSQSQINWVTNELSLETLGITLSSISAIILMILPTTANQNNIISVLTITVITAVVSVFLSSEFLTLFISFEISIIPTILIVTKFGNYQERASANMFMILITIASSIPIMINTVSLVNESNSTLSSINKNITENEEQIIVIIMIIFLAKLPIFVIHIWLPNAHVQAPTLGSMVLAGIILNLGGFGSLIVINMINVSQTSMLTTIAVISASTIAMLSTRQSDNNTTIAYSSVSHIMFILASITSIIPWIIKPALISIVAHGIVSPLMFLGAGSTIENQKSNNNIITKSTNQSSSSSLVWICLLAANISAPPSINFMIEIEILINIINNNANVLLTSGIMIISVICMNMATIFSQGNKKNSINMNNNTNNQITKVTMLILVLMITVSSTNISCNPSWHVKPNNN